MRRLSYDELKLTKNDLMVELVEMGAYSPYNEGRRVKLIRERIEDLLNHISVTDNIKL